MAEFIGRGTAPRYASDESGVFAINQKCIRNGLALPEWARPTDPSAVVKADSVLRAGDVCVNSTGTGTIGRVGLWAGLCKGVYFADTHVTVVRPKVSMVDSKLLTENLLSPSVQKEMETTCFTGSTNQVELSKSQFSELRLLLPPLPEQRKIAAILSSVDQAIEATQQVVDQLQVVKRAMMQDLLTRGIPGRHKRFKQTEIGEVPEEWEVRPFGDICTKIVDGVHKKPEYVRDGIPFVTVKNLTAVDEGISFEELNYVTPDDHAQFIRRAHPEQGDVLLTKDGTLGVPRVVETSRIFSIFVSVAVMKPIRTVIDSWFLRFALEAPPIAAHFGVVNAGLALKHIHLVDLRATPCPIPPLAEQVEIADALRSIGNRIAAEKMGLDVLREVKAALMSVLLTGEVRVKPDPEEAA